MSMLRKVSDGNYANRCEKWAIPAPAFFEEIKSSVFGVDK